MSGPNGASPDVSTVGKVWKKALEQFKAGRLDQAEEHCTAILDTMPNHLDAINMLGVVAQRTDRHKLALKRFEQAMSLDSSLALIHINASISLFHLGQKAQALAALDQALTLEPDNRQAQQIKGEIISHASSEEQQADPLQNCIFLHRRGRLDAAASCYLQVLRRQPDHIDALNNLGLVLTALGKADAAIPHFEKALRLKPDFAQAHNNMGNALDALGKSDAAAAQFRQALACQPDFPEALHNLGSHLGNRGKVSDAIQLLERALALNPDFCEAHQKLGDFLAQTGKAVAALEHLQRAVAINPNRPGLFNTLGTLLNRENRRKEAVANLEQALQLKPDYPEALNNLGVVLSAMGRVQEAVERFRQALALQPEYADAINNLGGALSTMGRSDEAAACYARALELKPDFQVARIHLAAAQLKRCDFQGVADSRRAIEQTIMSGKLTVNFTLNYIIPFLALGDDARKICHELSNRHLHIEEPPFYQPRPKDGSPLKIGHLSPNFGDHPISHVTRKVFSLHDRKKVKVIGYSLLDRSGDDSDHYRDIRESCDDFVCLAALSDRQAARRIANDQVDILINLSGYMPNHGLGICRLRPAPVQAYWLGHGGTLGLSFIDYMIADTTVIPDEDISTYSEKTVRLPENFQPADTGEITENGPGRKEYGLGEDNLVFCVFNNSQKIDASAFKCWMRIMQRVPDSQLWLSVPKTTAQTAANLKKEAKKNGVDPRRLLFATRVPDKRDHFARIALADLFLDTFTVNASTSAIDALWAGLPMVTRYGGNYFSRTGASMLKQVGLEELICRSTEEYEELAVALARDRNRLKGLRDKLARNRFTEPLFDAQRFVDHLETAYEAMWQNHRSGNGHQAIDVPPLPRKQPVR